MSILVVDDSSKSRLVLKTYLNSFGYHDLEMVASASEALRYLGVTEGALPDPTMTDLILLDVLMPEVDGIQACRLIKSTPKLKDIPILMITAQDEESYLEQAFAAGAIDYLTKPISKVDLQARVASALALKQEIDSRKLAYQELERQLIQSQKLASLGQLVGGVAHDFNNVLTVMMGYSQLGMLGLDAENPLYGQLEQLLNAAEHASSLTAQLLSLTRTNNAESKVIDVNNVVTEACKMLSRLLPENVELITLLWEEPVQIQIDPNQIEQVLINLSINARDSMPDGGMLIIETSTVYFDETFGKNGTEPPAGTYALLTVTDTGAGISDDVKSKIFEPFFTTKEEVKGTGLGLATCYAIVKEAGGYIAVDSEIGSGTNFRVFVPLALPDREVYQEPERCTSMPGGSETILLAEDETALREMIATVLNQQGYTVVQATNGAEGLIMAKEQPAKPIDLLFSDVVMPQMGGIELAHQLMDLRPGIKIILTSGYTESNVSQEVPEAVFIPKPFLPAILATKVREALFYSSSQAAVSR